MCYDAEDVKSLGLLLSWLRKWRRGDFSRAEADRKAGGVEERRKAWLWGEDLWLGALDEEACEFGVGMKAGGRSKSPRATEAEVRRVVELRPGLSGDLNVQTDGDKAQSTKKAYYSAWEKWGNWSREQKWLTPYLSYKTDPGENENKLLGYLGYLGWFGTSVVILKQAVFAIKDARKRTGYGDVTGKMHRLWIVINSLERSSEKRPRRLGVTVSMLKEGSQDRGEFKMNCRMIVGALLTAWFFMLRAREFCDSCR